MAHSSGRLWMPAYCLNRGILSVPGTGNRKQEKTASENKNPKAARTLKFRRSPPIFLFGSRELLQSRSTGQSRSELAADTYLVVAAASFG